MSELKRKTAHEKRLFKAKNRLRDKVNDARLLNDDIRAFISAWGYLIVFLVLWMFSGLAASAAFNLLLSFRLLSPHLLLARGDRVFGGIFVFTPLAAMVGCSFMANSQLWRLRRARSLKTTVTDARMRMEVILQQTGLTKEQAADSAQIILDEDHAYVKTWIEMRKDIR
jgi:hypothetical protein